ncbi:MAG: hypothetical protein ACLGIA_10280 [Actinomycetes bacterium]
MGFLDRLRARVSRATPPVLKPALRSVSGRAGARRRSSVRAPLDLARENGLRMRLHDDPNDERAFDELAEIVRHRAALGHVPEGKLGQPVPPSDPERAANDAVWALAEEVAQNHRAWHPLVELARLSIHNDRKGALRRLGTAAERDPSGCALVEGLEMLRQAGLPDEALGLGVGHWRPREHDVEAGRQLVQAAVEAGRVGEARRHLEALSQHPDKGRVAQVREELDRLIPAPGRRP